MYLKNKLWSSAGFGKLSIYSKRMAHLPSSIATLCTSQVGLVGFTIIGPNLFSSYYSQLPLYRGLSRHDIIYDTAINVTEI